MPIDPAADSPTPSSDVEDLPLDKRMSDFSAEVRLTAYSLWEQAGRPSGREDDFWYKALDQRIQALANAEKRDQNPPPRL
jgi:hypothetical protein